MSRIRFVILHSLTTLTLAPHVTHGLHFPSTIALITHCHQSFITLITRFISLGLPLSHGQVLFCYCRYLWAFSLCEFPVDYLDCLYSSDRLLPAFWIFSLSAACPDLCIVPVHVWALPTLLLLRLTELCLPDLLLLLIKLHLDLNITDSSLQLKLKLAK